MRLVGRAVLVAAGRACRRGAPAGSRRIFVPPPAPANAATCQRPLSAWRYVPTARFGAVYDHARAISCTASRAAKDDAGDESDPDGDKPGSWRNGLDEKGAPAGTSDLTLPSSEITEVMVQRDRSGLGDWSGTELVRNDPNWVPKEVIVIPVFRRPIFPGIATPIALTDPELCEAVLRLKNQFGSNLYVGLFLAKTQREREDG